MMSKINVQVSGKSKGMQSVLNAGNHTITIDEPPNMGGQDSGADPLSTLLSSLAGCENVIANLVAKEINFDLKGIDFDIVGVLDPRGLMGDETVKPYFEKVTINAKVDTSESQERIDELQGKVDKRCPVYTTLEAAGIELVPNWTKA
ncbi:OsmC family protein [Bacillus solimangrovi]|uniref:Osmotically inducible protein C n=1 Tax=Bacillus solimangrovi TaxID=1305675 RepID=A0A1E5LDR6_9BACI|nr:OsmC family protein [Bacillus solimangrovi]OEH92227.1 osmotically inducible protein C [Bacillus solimangrovi]